MYRDIWKIYNEIMMTMKPFLFLGLLLCVSCKTTWNDPMMEYEENDSPKVLSIEFRDTATIVEMEHPIRYGFTISDATVLVTDAMNTSILRWKRNVKPFMGFYSDETVRFTLGFDAVPKGTKRLDFIESPNEKDFRIWGLRPKGKQLTAYNYSPSKVKLNNDDQAFLQRLLEQHLGKVIVLQVLDDLNGLESVDLLNRTVHARDELSHDQRISFVTFSRPDGKEYEEGEKRAILVGKEATNMEHITLQDYLRLVHLVRPHLAKDNTVCLDRKLQILKPGLVFRSLKLLELQLNLLTE